MKLQVDGEDAPINDLILSEDLNQYYSVVTFTTSYFLYNNKVKLVGEINSDLTVIRSELENGYYKNVAVPSDTYKLINSVCQPFSGSATVKSLVQNKLSLNFESDYDSVATYWMLPKLKVINVIKELNKYTKVSNGGGAHFYVNLDGKITFTDYLREFSLGNVYELSGTIVSDKVVTDWVSKVPSVIDIYSSSSKGIAKETLTIYDNYGKGSMFVNDTTGNLLEMRKQMLVNDFYNNFFNSRKITISIPALQSLKLGTVYSVNNRGKFILSNYSITYNFGERIPEINVGLISCPR